MELAHATGIPTRRTLATSVSFSRSVSCITSSIKRRPAAVLGHSRTFVVVSCVLPTAQPPCPWLRTAAAALVPTSPGRAQPRRARAGGPTRGPDYGFHMAIWHNGDIMGGCSMAVTRLLY